MVTNMCKQVRTLDFPLATLHKRSEGKGRGDLSGQLILPKCAQTPKYRK